MPAAGLDMFEEEPAPADQPPFALEDVIMAPHALCWTDECFAGNLAADVAAVLAVTQGQVPRGIVNRGIVNRGIVDHAGLRAELEGHAQRFGGASA